MKLLTLTLNNFRQFYGRQEIRFSTDAEKNITLIHAENGVGKTALLNAIRWCLFEETTDNFRDPKNLLNHEACDEGEYHYSVEIEFEEDGSNYSCARGINAKNEPYFKVLKEALTGYQSVPDASLFINSIIPKNMASYFFFQGEGVSSFARTTSGANHTVKNAIHDVLGFRIAQQTLGDLNIIKSEYRREITTRDKGGEIGKANEQLSRYENEKLQLSKDISSCSETISLYERKKQDVDDKLKNSNADVIKQNHLMRANLESRKQKLEKEITQYEQKTRKLLGKYLSSIFASKLASEALDFINEEEFKGTIPAPYNENLVRDILEQATCICGADIHEGSQAFENIQKLLAKAADPLQGDRVTRARETLKAIRILNKNAYSDINDNNNKLYESRNQLEEVKTELAQISFKIANSNIDDIKTLEADRKDYEKHISYETRRLGQLEAKLETNNNERRRLELNINQLSALSKGLESLQESISIIENIENLLSDTLTRAEKSALLILPTMINEVLSKYVRQDYRAKLSKDTFNIQLIDRSERVVAESDGQQLLLSLTFISSLIKFASQRKSAQGEILMPGAIAPFVIDAPFGVLDNAYKGNMAKYIPESAEQVVFLLSSSHWEGAVEENIRKRVGAEYNLVAEVSTEQGEKEHKPIIVCGKTFETARYGCEKDRTVIEEIRL